MRDQAADGDVLAEHRGGEAADAGGPGRGRELAGEQRAEAAALQRVAHDDRELGGVGRVGQAHAAGDGDDRVGVVGEHGDERDVVAAVDLGQVAQLSAS